MQLAVRIRKDITREALETAAQDLRDNWDSAVQNALDGFREYLEDEFKDLYFEIGMDTQRGEYLATTILDKMHPLEDGIVKFCRTGR